MDLSSVVHPDYLQSGSDIKVKPVTGFEQKTFLNPQHRIYHHIPSEYDHLYLYKLVAVTCNGINHRFLVQHTQSHLHGL
jgi:hypothetical protein